MHILNLKLFLRFLTVNNNGTNYFEFQKGTIRLFASLFVQLEQQVLFKEKFSTFNKERVKNLTM